MTKRTHHHGFTLVEILIVVVILGILASIVIPHFSEATSGSKSVATASITRTVQSKIFEDFATQSEFPSVIEPSWFVEGTLPHNPLAPDQTSPMVIYDTSASNSVTHPASKLVSTSGAFWYNPNNGAFRALVPAQNTEAQTLKLYNDANSAQVSSLAATGE